MIDLKKFADFDQLQEIQDLFSDATGLAAIAVDASGSYITKGSNFTDFCMKYTRGTAEGLRRCVQCDNECSGTYFCHAGLMDFSTPLVIGAEKVGAIIGGQVLPMVPDEAKFREIARELGVDENAYLAALKKVPVKSEATIRAAAMMLGKVVNLLLNFEYMQKMNSKKVKIFDAEMENVLRSVSTVTSKTKDLQRAASMEKILSLNAAVEAARAGEAGVGFAVVAHEIGELSNTSAGVYSEIQESLAGIKTSINAMNCMEL